MRTQTANRNIQLLASDKLRTSDKRLDIKKIEKNIIEGIKQPRIYLIAESENQGELYVIYKANELLLSLYDDKRFVIVGVAKGRRSALKLLGDIILESDIVNTK